MIIRSKYISIHKFKITYKTQTTIISILAINNKAKLVAVKDLFSTKSQRIFVYKEGEKLKP